jgi:hypothetical protein
MTAFMQDGEKHAIRVEVPTNVNIDGITASTYNMGEATRWNQVANSEYLPNIVTDEYGNSYIDINEDGSINYTNIRSTPEDREYFKNKARNAVSISGAYTGGAVRPASATITKY